MYQYGKKKLTPIHLQDNNVSIDSEPGYGKVDFANKYIGGGALTKGLVQ